MSLLQRCIKLLTTCSLLLIQTSVFAEINSQNYLKSTMPVATDMFGSSVAVSGNTLVVGADQASAGAGEAFVFEYDENQWEFKAKLESPNAEAGGRFSSSVAIDGNTIVIGARRENFNAGAAYVFVGSGTDWVVQARLEADFPRSNDEFGNAVAISGDAIVIGESRSDDVPTVQIDAGKAHVFVRNGTTWSHQQNLKASNFESDDEFGWDVAISGDLIAVGAPFEDSGPSGDDLPSHDYGAVYVFQKQGSSWVETEMIKASNPDLKDYFGYSVDIDGTTLAVGAPNEDGASTAINMGQTDNSAADAGAVYVFTDSGSGWVQEAYIKAGNSEAADQFGHSIAISGNRLLVGADREAGSANGVNNAQDNTAQFAGAAYYFTRQANTWQTDSYIKASNTDSGDFFGTSVDLNGPHFAVGAIREDSASAATPSDNSVDNAGAAYTYFDSLYVPAITINAGMNDAWVSEDAPLQGWFITIFPNLKFAFLSWFTFDSQLPGADTATLGASGHRWVTASGGFEGNTVTLTAELTSGGIFNGSFPVAKQVAAYGTITIEFISCNEAILTYDFPSAGLSGKTTIKRVLPSNVGLCESLQSN